jgi:hypothetical protein
MNSSTNTACRMPETGVLPPAVMLVPVRAITPVAGKPPNRGEAMLAAPCAMISTFERWRLPAMVSAATADSSDSTATRNAMVNALGSTASIVPQDRSGSAGAGRVPSGA